MLGDPPREPPLGSILLEPHQASSIEPILGALDQFGGALLCDQVGMGKTFVALAIARRFQRVLIVGPAALDTMWGEALSRAGLAAGFLSYERLSRSKYSGEAPDLLILDEAHHARNPATLRYERISRLAREARVLMLTATPVHNRRGDLAALLSIFLGSRADNLTEAELARCVIRRDRATAGIPGIPHVEPVISLDLPDDPETVSRLMSLPPPLPVRDGGSGGSLVNRGLLHQWCSSEAALRDALRRRVASAAALTASLKAGRYPSAVELRAWTYADGALQLGFPELLAPPAAHAGALLEAVVSHSTAVEKFLKSYSDASRIDEARANHLRSIRRENPEAKIVAFAQYSSTIAVLFRRIVVDGQAAMLTAGGAWVAGGRLSRKEAIDRFAPRANRIRPPTQAEAIEVLLCTDLLSEGVNLQDAGIVFHLDVPWTAARMEQRVGRIARMGSSHPRISVYQLRPPASAEAVLRIEALVERKWNVARTSVGVNSWLPSRNERNICEAVSSIPARADRLRTLLERWSTPDAPADSDRIVQAAAVSAGQTGFIAAGCIRNSPLLLTCRAGTLSIDLDAQADACVLAESPDSVAGAADFAAVCAMIERWADQSEAMESAGAAVPTPMRRKALLDRIDALVQNSPPHLRASRAPTAAIARLVAMTPHGAAVEQELAALANAPAVDDEWLGAIAALDSLPPVGQPAHCGKFQLRALLVFTT